MLTPLSIMSLDQGPKWRDPVAMRAPTAGSRTEPVAEASRGLAGRLLGLWPKLVAIARRPLRRPVPSRS